MARKDELFRRVDDVLTEEAFDARIQEEVEAWGGLLDEDAAALLVVDKLGRNEIAFGRVEDLYEGGEALLQVQVDEVGPIREFERRDGSVGRVTNLKVSDGTGAVRLVLWDEEVDLVAAGEVALGTPLRVVDGYVRRGPYGLEVVTGKWGVLLPDEA